MQDIPSYVVCPVCHLSWAVVNHITCLHTLVERCEEYQRKAEELRTRISWAAPYATTE